MNAAELKASIDARIKGLAEATSAALRSEQFLTWLQAMAKFHHYSLGNQMLITFANPDATRVAGYRAWLRLGRHVRRGEHGIPILAPCPVRQKSDQEEDGQSKRSIYFKTAYVFDVSQTEGDDLPELDWVSPEKSVELHDRLVQFAATQMIPVVIEPQKHGAQGSTDGKTIWLDPEAGTKTLIHELAHCLCKHPRSGLVIPREIQELEAEAIAYVVGRHFGLPAAGSPNYLATWFPDPKGITGHMDRIRDIAAQIITAIEPAAPAEPVE